MKSTVEFGLLALALGLASVWAQTTGDTRVEATANSVATYARLAPLLSGAAYAYESSSLEPVLPVPLSAELVRSVTSGPKPLCGPDVLEELDRLAAALLLPPPRPVDGADDGTISGVLEAAGTPAAEDAQQQLALYEAVKGVFGWLAAEGGCGGLGDTDCVREQVAAALAPGGALEAVAARTAAACGLGAGRLAEAAGHLAAALAALAAPERQAALVHAAEHVARAGWCTCGQSHGQHTGAAPHGDGGAVSSTRSAAVDVGAEEEEEEVASEAVEGPDEGEEEEEEQEEGDHTGELGGVGSSSSSAVDTAGGGRGDGAHGPMSGGDERGGEDQARMGPTLRQISPGVLLRVSDSGEVIQLMAEEGAAADGSGSGSDRGSSGSSGGNFPAGTIIGVKDRRRLRSISKGSADEQQGHRRHHRHHQLHRHHHRRQLQQTISISLPFFGSSSSDLMRNVKYNYNLPPVPPPAPTTSPPRVLLPLVFHVMVYKDAATGQFGPPGYDSAPVLAARTLAALNLLTNGTGVSFFLQEVRWDPQRYPYLLVGSPADWQTCGAVVSGAVTESPAAPDCLKAQAEMVDFPRAINVYFVGSSSLGLSPGLAAAGSSPVGSLREVPVWLSWNNLDSPARGGTNGQEAFNAGSSVLWHELGHYLGLRHTFPADGKCANSDGVDDTPNVAATASSLYLDRRLSVDIADYCYTVFMRDLQGKLSGAGSRVGIPEADKNAWADTCPNDPGFDELGNFMTYTLPACRAGLGHLTPGQVSRIQLELFFNRHMYQWGRYWADVQPPEQLLAQQPQQGDGEGDEEEQVGGAGTLDPGRPDTSLCTAPLRYPGCTCKGLWINLVPPEGDPSSPASSSAANLTNLAQRGSVPVWQGGGCAPYYSRSNAMGEWACEVEDGCTVNGKTYSGSGGGSGSGAGAALVLPCEGAKYICTNQPPADNTTLEEAICTRPTGLPGCTCKSVWRLRGRTYRGGCAPVGALMFQDPNSWWCEVATPCVVAGKSYAAGTITSCDERAATVCPKYQQQSNYPAPPAPPSPPGPPSPQPPAAKPTPSPKRRAGRSSPPPSPPLPPPPSPSPSPSPTPTRVRGG